MINKQKLHLVQVALQEYGVLEIAGELHNERILQYSKDTGMNWVQDDETAWCSIFINWCCLKSGLPRSGKPNARSWLDVGVETKEPEIGDLVVLWRDKFDSWKGHVGIYINKIGSIIYILGGNQNNMVSIKSYYEERLLGYRDLTKSFS